MPLLYKCIKNCLFQMLSRQKPAIGPGSATPAKDKQKKKQLPKVEEFLENRDYTGAITLLEVTDYRHLTLIQYSKKHDSR